MLNEKNIRRVVIEGVTPEIDGGRFPIKRVVGEDVTVEADIFCDGHDAVAGVLQYRKKEDGRWRETPFVFLINDRWQASFQVSELGRYVYTLCAWVDQFQTWRRDLQKKAEAGFDVSVELLAGAGLIKAALARASKEDAAQLKMYADVLREGAPEQSVAPSLEESLLDLMGRYPDRESATFYGRELEVVVDREKARFSSWYEMFPRSASPEPGRHGTFADCEKRLPYIAEMGFDVLYLPPIHPIGETHRKGKNNTPAAQPGDPGSPWAIGSREGGYRAVHPQIGTLEDFRRLLERASGYGIEVALDIAFQSSPDHPYVGEHPLWYKRRPDGTVQYAENPPKKYEDIYPFDFESAQWPELVRELREVIRFWIAQGVRIFRVDNPHTKPFLFWEWLIDTIKAEHPEVIFLAEAFTRPKIMYRLAKLGFTQSYTYFTWRNTAWEIRTYFTELTQTAVREFFRPHLWPNTPDILSEYLQMDNRPAFMARLVLAATLSAGYGIYGPAFELGLNHPKAPGSEEYLDSEKYEIKYWNIYQPHSLKDFIARVNHIRRENPALQNNFSLRFHPVDNEQLLCYSKHSEDLSEIVVVAVNLDPHHTHAGWAELPLEALKLDPHETFQVHDLLSDARYLWHGHRNYIELDPRIRPAHIFRIRRKIRTERDFDYYL